jgi:hypothetical protein
VIRLRGYVIRCGAAIGDKDWWLLSVGIAEGIISANAQWMRERDLDALDLKACGIRYRVAPPLVQAGELLLQVRLAPAVLHGREGSCLDLACFVAARERCRGRATGVRIEIDPITQGAHAIAVLDGRDWDPASLEG